MVKGAHHLAVCVVICMTVNILSRAHNLDRQIKKLTYNNNGFGTYSFEFETDDGTFRREEGGLVKSKRDENELLAVRGEYGYLLPDGRLYYVRYIADENGFQPQFQEDSTRFNDRRIL